MGKWARLTQDKNSAGIWYRHLPDHIYPHRFSCQQMSNAEALVFSAQLPEVKAQGHAIKSLYNAIQKMIQAWDDYEMLPALDVNLYKDALVEGLAALAPFEEIANEES